MRKVCCPPRAPPLLADHATDEAGGGTRHDGVLSVIAWARRGKDRAAEILLEPVGDVIPELDHLLGGAPVRVDLHDGAAVDHRGGIIGAMVEGDRSDGAVL